jgi:hypothetical protein
VRDFLSQLKKQLASLFPPYRDMFAEYMADDSSNSGEHEQEDELIDDKSIDIGTRGPRVNSPRKTTPPSVYLSQLEDAGPHQRSPQIRSPDIPSREPSTPPRKKGLPPGMESKETIPPYSPPPEENEDDIVAQQQPLADILTTLNQKIIGDVVLLSSSNERYT